MTEQRWTVMDALRWTTDAFESRGFEGARREAELLLSCVVGLGRIELYAHFDRPLSPQERSDFRDLIKRRGAGEPVQYILGTQEFWSLSLHVDPRVLIPRSDTEVLVEEVVAWCHRAGAPRPARIADVGTGSGAIAIALAHELRAEVPQVRAVDVSEDALAVARDNASQHKLGDRIEFFHGSLLAPAMADGWRPHVVVSNPPYIDTGDMRELPAHIARHEPELALWGGEDGLAVIGPLAKQARQWLEPGGLFVCEIGTAAQAKRVQGLLEELGFADVRARDDYAHTPRAILGTQRAS